MKLIRKIGICIIHIYKSNHKFMSNFFNLVSVLVQSCLNCLYY